MTSRATTRQEVRRRVAQLVESSTDGQVSAAEAELSESLVLIGVDSLASLRLIDAVEREFGIALEVEMDVSFLDSVDGLADYLVEHGLSAGPKGMSEGGHHNG